MNTKGLLWPILFLAQQHLARAIPSVTQRMLTLQLHELEADGVVLRTVQPEVPPRNVWGRNYQNMNDLKVEQIPK